MKSLLSGNQTVRNAAVVRLILYASIFLLMLSSVLLLSCGKKGPPTLSSHKQYSAPSLLGAIHREDKIILTWHFPEDRETGIKGFHIFRQSGNVDFTQIAFVESGSRILIDTDFSTAANYVYKMTAESADGGASHYSDSLSVMPVKIPQPPESTAFKITRNSVELSWDQAGNDVFFNVYKSFKKGSYDLYPINEKPLTVNVFNDSLSFKKAVYYSIRSHRNSPIRDEGYPSKEIEITPAVFVPSPPQDPRYFSSEETILLYWEESPEPWVIRYRIYRRMEGQEYEFIGESVIPAYSDSENLLIRRDYRISAVGPVEEGHASELKDVRFTPPP
jgi:hypothetical protein